MMKMLIIFVAIRVKSIFASSISPLATLAMIFGLFSPFVKAQSITPANDGTGTVITTEGNKIDISGGSLSSDRTNLFHSFSQFGLDANQTANFLSQPSIQNILGRVTGNSASLINGLIQVTGGNSNLYLINPAGIIFGSSASLNVPAAFTATTANGIGFGNNEWFNAIGSNNYANLIGNPTEFAFTTSLGGSIFNAGNLAVGEAQSLMLLGGMVLNTGTLTAPNGNVTIMAVPAEKIVRVTASNSLFSLDLPVETKNQINPQPFSPRSLPSLLTGGNVTKVTGVTVENGVVKLISTNTAIPTDVGTTILSGKVSVSNSSEAVNNVSNNTGQINILGDRIALLNANINASGSNGGRVLIGGDYQGKGTVPNASHTYISSDSAIAADAWQNGNGGKVIVWADDTTRFFGNITARGGAIAGNGGLVETSGKLSLDVTGSKVDASAAKGKPGTWLLDPTDINIVTGGSGTLSGGLFDPANNSDIDPLTIATALDNGTDVTITTSSGTGGNGDITLTDGINQTGGGTASLTLTSRQFLNPNYLININLSSTGNLTFNLNQVNPETNASTDSIQNAIDAIGTVAGNSIINLGAGTYTGNTVNIFEKTLTLNGAGASNTIFDGNNINQVFGIFSQGTVTINNLAIINGRGFGIDGGGIAYFSSSSGTLNVNNVTFTDNSTEFNIEGGGNGGAIYSEYGTLNVNNSTFNSNSATDSNGGGIYSLYSTLNVNNSTFSGNFASDGRGGGIYNISDNQSGLNVNNSTFNTNSAIDGGGIYNDGINGGRLDFNNSNFISNLATSGNGGGIYNYDTTGNVNNSTFSGNLASNGRGGGIYNEGVFINVLTVNNSTFNANSAIDGGGIYNNIGVSLNVNNSTFGSNSAINGNGGGIYNSLDTLNVNNSTLSGNSATDGGGILSESRAPTTLKNTIVAGNTSSQNPDVSGVLLGSSSNNLIGDGTGTTGISNGVSGNQVGTAAIPINPLLSVLGNYGGSTQTFALLPGSPAINAGISDTNITTDQRGISRPQDTTPDIGAFELVGYTLTATAGSGQSAIANNPFATPLQATVTENGFNQPIPGITVNFTAPTTGASANFTGNTTLITDSAGNVSIPVTANTIAGSYAVTAASGTLTPANFSLTNNPDIAAAIIATGGTPQNTIVNTGFTNPLQARVQDQYGNAIANATVTFNAPTSGATASFTGSTTLTTDSAGNVSIPVTANTVAGSYAVTANSGILTPANFSLTNNPDIAAAIIATGGTPQSTIVNTAFTNPLQAKVQDQYGNAIANATVTFNAPTSGATANFTGNTSLTTDSSGNVSIPVTANTVAGSYAVTANSGTLTPANFSLTNNPDIAAAIIATGGTPQTTIVNTGFINPLQAKVQDQYGNAIANATVTFNAPTTGATANFTGNTSLTTNSSGNVSIPVTANTVEGNYTVTANSGALTPANFSLTNNAASEVPTTPTVPIDTPNPEVLKKPPSTQIPVTINSTPEVVLDTAVANIEQEYTTEYKEYLGEEAKPNLEAPNTARNILQQISDATGIQPALIYVNFIPTSVSPAITLKQNKAKIQPSPNDRLELLIVTAQGLPIRKVLPVTRSQVIGTAQTFIKDITKSARNNSYKDPAKKLYEWLITPLEPELQARKVNNIAFIMDAGLRSLPVAALYDGQKYLVESYSVGLMPSLSLTDTKFVDIKKAEVLGMGASEFRNQNPLPAVPTELVTITSRLWQGNFFLNESFTLTNLQKQRQQKPFGIIHLATHAEFEPGDRGNSYIQMWDSQLKMDQLRKLGWNNPPVQLVVLSSCRTAIGDKEAELGFAGFAVQAGVKTALASLWYVSDEGTLGLMSEFYEQLKKAPIKAEALRQAQIAMIKGQVRLQDGKLKTSNVNVTLPPILVELGNQELRHPYYWSAFTLIGNPW
ncbi:CHAT domain-containing protein [Nostoc linckia FACHB-104]|nr:CHAT domain-containing protein [Nostoc linckia FACHB-104]